MEFPPPIPSPVPTSEADQGADLAKYWVFFVLSSLDQLPGLTHGEDPFAASTITGVTSGNVGSSIWQWPASP